jgi:hypothetical protein
MAKRVEGSRVAVGERFVAEAERMAPVTDREVPVSSLLGSTKATAARSGNPRGEVRTAWRAKEVVRSIYEHHDPDLGPEFTSRLGADLQDGSCPPEARQLGRTFARWCTQIAAWHRAHVSNGPTEAANNLIKRVRRIAFGFRRFASYWIRVLLYAGKPNWTYSPISHPAESEGPVGPLRPGHRPWAPSERAISPSTSPSRYLRTSVGDTTSSAAP